MPPKLSRYAVIALAVIVMSVYLPRFFQLVFAQNMGKTQLFFSPVIKKFIYREMVGEGYRFVTRDQSGKNYDRVTFETMLPFIYYRNMDLWGRLPLTIDGRTFDKQTIKNNRQVLELKPRMIADRKPRIQVFPLLESQAGRTRLRFPEDVFCMKDRMEFINVDTNVVDEDLTGKFTSALKEAGFVFPARLTSGRVSILKSFDEGFFITDADGYVYHVKRAKGWPAVVKTPIPADLDIRNIKVTENKKKEIYGTLLTKGGDLYLVTYDNYRLVKLPLLSYNPDTMDFKLLINPLYRTAIYSDDRIIHALVMDTRYQPIARYERVMFSGRGTMTDKIYKALFPYYIKTKDKTSGYMMFNVIWNGKPALAGIVLSLLICAGLGPVRRDFKKHWPDLAVIMCTGLYGLIAVTIIRPEL